MKKGILTAAAVVCGAVVFAQANENTMAKNHSSSDANLSAFASATEISLPPEPRNPIMDLHPSNQVFIRQIGNANISSTHLSAENAIVASQQKGNFNSVHISVTAESMRETVLQDGNRNHAFDFAFDPSEEISLHLAQKGSGQHFARHGSNSIGNQLQIKMSGNSTAVIVRNFK